MHQSVSNRLGEQDLRRIGEFPDRLIEQTQQFTILAVLNQKQRSFKIKIGAGGRRFQAQRQIAGRFLGFSHRVQHLRPKQIVIAAPDLKGRAVKFSQSRCRAGSVEGGDREVQPRACIPGMQGKRTSEKFLRLRILPVFQ